MVLRRLKYGFARTYPVTGDIPATPDLRPSCDVVIVRGGGHGLVCAHHLARYHGIRSVAVLEKGLARRREHGAQHDHDPDELHHRAVDRSCCESVVLWEGLSAALDFNVMFSQRGQRTLAQTEATLRAFHPRAETVKHLGIGIEVIGPDAMRARVPDLSMDTGGALEILDGFWRPDGGTPRHDAMAWGQAREAARQGVEFHQSTAVTGFRVEGGRVTAVETDRGTVAAGAVLIACGGMNHAVASMAGIDPPIRWYPLLAMVTEPVKPWLHARVSAVSLHT